MKKKSLLFIVIPLLFASCFLEEKNLFDETTTERKLAAIEEYTQILKSADNGWVFECFPHKTQAYGGYNYLVKFGDVDSVYASFGYIRNPEILQSLYEVKYDYGTMLSFNTYNEYLHYFAEGRNTGTLYQGYGGEYEFMCMNYDDANGILKLKGKRTSNYLTMTKLADNVIWNEYLDAVNKTETQWNNAYYLVYVDGVQIGTAYKEGRIITFSSTENGEELSVTASLIYRPDGNIHFYDPVEIGGVKVQNFKFDSTSDTITSTDTGTKIVLEVTVPEGFTSFKDYLGDWTLTDAYGDEYSVTFTQDVFNQSYIMTSDEWEFLVKWNWSSTNSGRKLNVYCQQLGTSGTNLILLLPAYLNATGGVSFWTTIGTSYATFSFDGISTLSCDGGSSALCNGFVFYIRNSTNSGNVGYYNGPNRFLGATLTR